MSLDALSSVDDAYGSYSLLDRETWATSLLEAGSHLQRPLYWVSKEVHHIPTPLEPGCSWANAQEVFRRAIYGWIVPSFTYFGFGVTAFSGSIFYRLGTMLRRNNFTHWQGRAPEKTISELQEKTCKVMSFNIRGWPGATSLWKGVPEWQKRIDDLKAQLVEEDPDVLCLSEVKDAALIRELFEGCRDRFAHFFVHLGKGSDLFIASKFPVERFSFEHYRKAKEGFAHVDLSSNGKVFSRITATHLPPDAARNQQLEQLIQSISQKHLQNLSDEKEIPKVLCISGMGEEERKELFDRQRLFDPDLEQTEETSRDFPPFLRNRESDAPGKFSETISVVRRLSGGINIPGTCISRKVTLSPGYDASGVKTSDCHGIVARIQV